MIENNIIFSLIVSLVNTVAFYLFTSRNKKDIVDKKRMNIIFKNIKNKSIKNNIDPKITIKIWKSIIPC